MGASGCGKSTLLNIIGLLDAPNDGSYLFDGTEVAKFNEKQRAGLRKANIGFVFQNFNLIDELSVYENVELPLIFNKVKSSERKQRVTRNFRTYWNCAQSKTLSVTIIWRATAKSSRCKSFGNKSKINIS